MQISCLCGWAPYPLKESDFRALKSIGCIMYFLPRGHVDPCFSPFSISGRYRGRQQMAFRRKSEPQILNRYARCFGAHPVNGQKGSRIDSAAFLKIKYTPVHFSIHDCPYLSCFSDALLLLSKRILCQFRQYEYLMDLGLQPVLSVWGEPAEIDPGQQIAAAECLCVRPAFLKKGEQLSAAQ